MTVFFEHRIGRYAGDGPLDLDDAPLPPPKDALTRGALADALRSKGVALVDDDLALLWTAVLDDCGSVGDAVSWDEWRGWLFEKHALLGDAAARLLLVRALDEVAFVREFRWWEPLLERLDEANGILPPPATRADAAPAAYCSCGGL